MAKGYRPWIKQRLGEKNDPARVVKIHHEWVKAKQGASNVARAILLFDAFLKGDMVRVEKLLREYFPGFGMSLGNDNSVFKQPTPELRRTQIQPKAVIRITHRAYADNEEDDGMGFSDLEIEDSNERMA